MTGGTPHVPNMFRQIGAASGPVQYCRIIPHDQIIVVLPLDEVAVLGLSCPGKEIIHQSLRLIIGYAIDVVNVAREVERLAAVSVRHHELMLGEGKVPGVDGFVDIRSSKLAIVPETKKRHSVSQRCNAKKVNLVQTHIIEWLPTKLSILAFISTGMSS